MVESALLIDMFVRGIAVGGLLAMTFAVQGSRRLGRQARLTTLAFGISAAAWVATESGPLWAATGKAWLPMFLACPVGAFFWLFVYAVFEDRPIRPIHLLPAAVLWTSGQFMMPDPAQSQTWLWASRNALSGLLSMNALYLIGRGWRGDLLEARRRLRTPVLGFGALFSITMVLMALGNRVHPIDAIRFVDVGRLGGASVMVVLTLGAAFAFLQARQEVFGAARRPETAADTRTDTADRLTLQRLDALMGAGAWQREGLTIGAVARELDIPEHRLRRLINQRLGHRNFADFVNGQRIEAAKRRLADPEDARTTVAAIAFDLGFGSLGPFNRAFRAATGSTPTEWRRQALAQGSPKVSETV